MKKYVFESLKFFCAAILCVILSAFATPARAALPSGYTELEYINMQAGSYLQTDIVPTYNGRVEMDFQTTTIPAVGGSFMGGRSAGYPAGLTFGFNVNKSFIFDGFSENRYQSTDLLTNNTRYKYTWNNQVAKLETGGSVVGTNTFTGTGTTTHPLFINGANNAGSVIGNVAGIYLYSFRAWNPQGTLIANFVPAKNSSGVVGMYDTVNNRFYTNAGTGEFIAGDPVVDTSCRNLLDTTNQLMPCYISADGTEHCNEQDFEMSKAQINVVEGEQYTLSWIAGSSQLVVKRIHGYDANGNWKGQISEQRTEAAGPYSITMTIPSGVKSVLISGKRNIDTDMQFEQGSTATPYVPYCATSIKIATTKYNESAFSSLNTALANAISVVDTVVSNTITQAGRIATLQAQKQTRPNDIADDNEKCPAGKKCLLVEDASGVPHWYEICSSAHCLPEGYTELEYIESTGTQYIDTNITGSTNAIIDMQGTPRTDDTIVFMLAPIDATAFQNGFGQYQSTMGGGLDIATRRVYNVSYTSSSLTVNGVSVSRYIANNVNLALFGSTASNRKIKDAKLYSAKIYNNDTLLRNFVPAKNSAGVIGMYDTVSGAFFENKGTGEFVAGDPVSE